jgi:PBSX family phage terminase large subunit
MADNYSITQERKLEIESQYVKGSVWYRRDIDGERCIAEGLVYPMYEKAISPIPAGETKEYCISIDYGTLNAFAALLWEKINGEWFATREYYYSGREEKIQKTDEQYARDIDAWCMDILPGQKIRTIVDPSAASFITLLQKRNGRYKVIKAVNAVSDGIRETANSLDNGYIKISPNLENWKEEAAGYVWDQDTDEDKPVKENDHLMDATRYFVKTMHIVRKANRRTE